MYCGTGQHSTARTSRRGLGDDATDHGDLDASLQGRGQDAEHDFHTLM
jgi:hypothetical protein